MNFYKVVAQIDGKLYSAITSEDKGNPLHPHDIKNAPLSRVRYQFGKWTKPRLRDSKLFCFKSLKAAKEFKEVLCEKRPTNFKYRLFKCAVKNPEVTKKDVSGQTRIEHIVYFWTWSKDLPFMTPPRDYFKGSIGVHVRADQIKLVKEI